MNRTWIKTIYILLSHKRTLALLSGKGRSGLQEELVSLMQSSSVLMNVSHVAVSKQLPSESFCRKNIKLLPYEKQVNNDIQCLKIYLFLNKRVLQNKLFQKDVLLNASYSLIAKLIKYIVKNNMMLMLRGRGGLRSLQILIGFHS